LQGRRHPVNRVVVPGPSCDSVDFDPRGITGDPANLIGADFVDEISQNRVPQAARCGSRGAVASGSLEAILPEELGELPTLEEPKTEG